VARSSGGGRSSLVPILVGGGVGAGLGVIVGGLLGGIFDVTWLPSLGAGAGAASGIFLATGLARKRTGS
jgi:hypothetical protein